MQPSYALFQHSLEPLDVDAVTAAFSEADNLTAIDARRMTTEANGVLVAGLAREPARALRSALLKRGLVLELVKDDWLRVPLAKACRRAEPTSQGLVMRDAFGKETTVSWERVKVIVGGMVPRGRSERVRDMQVNYTEDGTEFEAAEYRYVERDKLTIDVLLVDPIQRISFQSDSFDYSYLSKRKAATSGLNFAKLATDLVTYVNGAAIGAGVQLLIDDPRTTHRYRNERAFNRELAWLLWRRFGPGAALDGATPYRSAPFELEAAPLTFKEQTRAAVAGKVMTDNQQELARHMATHRKLDLALAVLAGVLVGGYMLLGPGGYGDDDSDELALALALLAFVVTTFVAYHRLRKHRGRSFWTG